MKIHPETWEFLKFFYVIRGDFLIACLLWLLFSVYTFDISYFDPEIFSFATLIAIFLAGTLWLAQMIDYLQMQDILAKQNAEKT